jgi:hypothetical protein
MNLGTGTFGVMTSINTTAAHDIEVLDVDVDGDLDIVQTGTGVTVVLGDGNGNFGTGTAYGSGTTYYIAKGDLNDDGRIDLVTSDYGGNVVRVFLSNGVGTFAEPTAYGAGTNPNGIKIGDMDADGDLDIVVANYNYGRFLSQALESVLSQTCPPDEILVIDDASTGLTSAAGPAGSVPSRGAASTPVTTSSRSR